MRHGSVPENQRFEFGWTGNEALVRKSARRKSIGLAALYFVAELVTRF
jgi:hypothetical protein